MKQWKESPHLWSLGMWDTYKFLFINYLLVSIQVCAYNCVWSIMPKKKTGQRKKAEKQKLRQKEIRNARGNVDLAAHPCNMPMECDKCQRWGGRRARGGPTSRQRWLMGWLSAGSRRAARSATSARRCSGCRRARRAARSSACWRRATASCGIPASTPPASPWLWVPRLANRPRSLTTAPLMLHPPQGAICDFCEAWVCHGRKCLTSHACTCPLTDAVCMECDRGTCLLAEGFLGWVWILFSLSICQLRLLGLKSCNLAWLYVSMMPTKLKDSCFLLLLYNFI